MRRLIVRVTEWLLELRNPGGAWISGTNRFYEDIDKRDGKTTGSTAAMMLCRLLVDTGSDALISTIKGFEVHGVVRGNFRVIVEKIDES